MSKSEPQSRRQTRSAILEYLLRSKGAFRPQIVSATSLTEATVIGGFNLAVNAKTKSPAAADLVMFLTGPRSVEAMRKADRLSAHMTATTPDAVAKLPEAMRPFMSQAAAGRARPSIAIWAVVHSSILSPAWDASVRGLMTPQAAVQKAASEIAAKMK